MPRDTWVPYGFDTGLSHTASPASQEVHKTTTSYQITAIVQDFDTWRSQENPSTTALFPAVEGQIGIETDPGDTGATVINNGWDSGAGKLTSTYVWVGTHTELSDTPGQIIVRHIKFRGVDNVTNPVALRDPASAWTDCIVNFMYAPSSGGGGG